MSDQAVQPGHQRVDDDPAGEETDQRAEAVILEHLRQSGIPVLGEESVAAGIVPSLTGAFFVVDPLDGRPRRFVSCLSLPG